MRDILPVFDDGVLRESPISVSRRLLKNAVS
jgi:hypothetical protein